VIKGTPDSLLFRQLEPLPEQQQEQLQLLRQFFAGFSRVCVAYSGGVDSALVAAIAKEQLGSAAIAVTGVSPALAPHLRDEARDQALWMDIRHQECETSELDDLAYSSNPDNRCFACKRELHRHLKLIAQAAGDAQLVDGVNHDDLGDHRPGIDAGRQAGVRSPLAELEIGKVAVRQISRALGLPWWNKPAQPCLASRFPYGTSISAAKLRQVGIAEAWLRTDGLSDVRVRSDGLAARIELPPDQLKQWLLEVDLDAVVDHFLSLGFTSVSLDLEGLVSGKLNRRPEA